MLSRTLPALRIELLGGIFQRIVRETCSAVCHPEYKPAATALDKQLDRPLHWRMFNRIVKYIGNRADDEFPVSIKHRGNLRLSDCQRNLLQPAQARRLLLDLPDARLHRKKAICHVLCALCPYSVTQQPRILLNPAGSCTDSLQQFPVSAGKIFLQQEFHIAPHHGERDLEVMGDSRYLHPPVLFHLPLFFQ